MSDPLPPPEEIDTGDPVAEIAMLAESPSERFLRRIRRSILRRISTSQFLEFALPMVLSFLREIGALLFGALEPRRPVPEAKEDE